MASQLRAVTRSPQLRVDDIARLNARLRLLPEIQRQKERGSDIQRQKQQFNRQMSMRKKEGRQTERAEEVKMGLAAGGLGLTAATSGIGSTRIADLNPFKKSPVDVGSSAPVTGMGSITAGQVLGGGLAGFGAGRMLGKKKPKWMRALAGAGAGGLMGMMGTPKGGSGMYGAGAGMLSGALGGLF